MSSISTITTTTSTVANPSQAVQTALQTIQSDKLTTACGRVQAIAPFSISKEFGTALLQVATSESPECPTLPENQEELSFALKIIKVAKLVGPLFRDDPAATNIEKKFGTLLGNGNQLLQKVGYDLAQNDSLIRKSFASGGDQSAVASIITGAAKTIEGIAVLGSGLLQLSSSPDATGGLKKIQDSFSAVLAREIVQPQTSSSSSSSSSSTSSTSSENSSKPAKHKLDAEQPVAQKPLKKHKK
jgi:hypothetical protein